LVRLPQIMIEFVAGGAAAITASCITHPLDVVKLRMFLTGELQPGVHPRLSLVRTMYATEGMRGFYAGLSAAVLRQALFSSTRFGVYAGMQRALGEGHKLPAALAAGTLAADVVLVRMQSASPRRHYAGVAHALRAIVVEGGGARALYAGVQPLVARGALVTAGQFLTYERVKQAVGHSLPAGVAAGFVAAALSTPADVIKSRLMNKSGTYTSAADCAVRTVRAEGVRGLYKGFVPAFVRMAPQVTIMWTAYELYVTMLR
jgi:solute carrier family 25 oxoglutarate transporter 11